MDKLTTEQRHANMAAIQSKEKMICDNVQETINKLQNEAKQFLTHSKLVANGIDIFPTEIEVYYYEVEGAFKDTSVHRNELQRNNRLHFYIHRWGSAKIDKYKGGNRAGLDFVVSGSEKFYYSYLLRSALINGTMVIGPNNVLKSILEATHCSYEDLESKLVEMKPNENTYDVLFSKRINLSTNAGEYLKCPLRAVLCDEFFVKHKYPLKECLILNFLRDKDKDWALAYAKKNLGYIPSTLRDS